LPLPYNKRRAKAPRRGAVACPPKSSTGVKTTNDINKILAELNEYNIEARYPEIKFRLYKLATCGFTKKALERTKKLKKWIEERL